ncbi:predicted protein [Nematostella vectensis]|uniref:Uncharacterized protein n=1 Tax=Nematostella vectensis TaxID=45351 RepID=A7S8A1_NEMVE|nr:predicted protein [Nematostella vectensis]|eukprot:XP_001632089.1 predicted protein [Nematostella vectensis]
MVELGAGDFDPVTFFKRPQVILRLICLMDLIGKQAESRGTLEMHTAQIKNNMEYRSSVALLRSSFHKLKEKKAVDLRAYILYSLVGLSVIALSRLRQHIQEAAYGDGLSGDNNPYAPFPPNNSEPVDPYQSRPFSEETQDETAGSDFKAPSY